MNPYRIKKAVTNFLTGEYFTDALRVTISIVLPAWVLFAYDLPQAAIAVGHGALLIGLTDSRGTIGDKQTTSVVSILLFFFVSVISSLSWPYPWLMGGIFFTVTLGCAMLMVYGSRFSITGTAAIILMIFIWGLKPANGLEFSLYLLAGGIWFYIVSLVQLRIWPVRYLNYAIADCLLATHDFLKAKALFYNIQVPLADCYNKAIHLHSHVSEKQEQVRSILLRDKSAMQAENRQGQALLFAASRSIDLYEQITAIHHDYGFLRHAFKVTGALDLVGQMIGLMADDIRDISEMEPFKNPEEPGLASARQMPLLEARFVYIIQKEDEVNARILSKLLANLKQIYEDIRLIYGALRNYNEFLPKNEPQPEYNYFAPFQDFGWSQLATNFRFSSPIFKFSLRLAITCLFCYTLANILPLGKYSYWILITVVVIMKPAFSLTRKRNMQRLTGTLIGVALALVILALVQSTMLLLAWFMIFLVGFFTFNRTHHMLSVVSLTPMVIIALNVYGNSDPGFIVERVYDTLIGCAIAFAATYMFPFWEAGRLPFLMKEVLKANTNYLQNLLHAISGKPENVTGYKLSRKNVYIMQANLSAAFQRMLGEPKNKITETENIYHFQMLNHILCSNIASLFLLLRSGLLELNKEGEQKRIDQAIGSLQESIRLIEQLNEGVASNRAGITKRHDEAPDNQHEHHDQLHLLIDVVDDIRYCSQALQISKF
ncbi:FUSC family protein [Dyadobacter bucti]|uniref:FUSC family protein n=1 Tax=Dyadobacter bucti TaxID=2572203 RepID=UPI001108F0A6|nr:FUSC family membrane protein [Dyadobacter bucti]